MRQHLPAGPVEGADLMLLGAPISRASISPSQAWSTPPAFRQALARFPTWDALSGSDISDLRIVDAGDVRGDVDDTDAAAAHDRIEARVGDLATRSEAVIAVIGGDNSLTRPALAGLMSAHPDRAWGLLTLDAHHDCRARISGASNGSPVRDLIEAGLDGRRVAQVGIHPQGNALEVARWADARGIHVTTVDEVRSLGIEAAVASALTVLRECGAGAIYVDLDVDVVDRASAPGCPASLPGGLAAADLVSAARLLGKDPGVRAVDLCEVDALADVAGITVRLMAAAFTAFAAGLTQRLRPL